MGSRQDVRSDAKLSVAQMKAAIQKIDRRIIDLNEFDPYRVEDLSDPDASALGCSLDELLSTIFGTESTQYERYRKIANLYRGSIYAGIDLPKIQEGYEKGRRFALATLEKIKGHFQEEIQDAVGTPENSALKAYEGLSLHPEIAQAVGALYRDGHYAEAIERAVKGLNNLVRLRSGEDLDGIALMQKVFSPNNPIIAFNKMLDQSDQGEQKGFMMLFCGAVAGLRNPRAHKIIQDDAERALEFIAFVSLLAKLLDEATNK